MVFQAPLEALRFDWYCCLLIELDDPIKRETTANVINANNVARFNAAGAASKISWVIDAELNASI